MKSLTRKSVSDLNQYELSGHKKAIISLKPFLPLYGCCVPLVAGVKEGVDVRSIQKELWFWQERSVLQFAARVKVVARSKVGYSDIHRKLGDHGKWVTVAI